MDMFDFAGMLFGRAGTSQQHSVTASGAASSEDGVASVTMDADVTPAEDVDGDADQTVIDLPTSPDVAEGDEAIVTLVGDGPLKTPVVTANPGSGDRMRALANSAKTVADAAQAVAEAVNQHFWHDDNGAHVTEATQGEWEQSHSGPNSLWNSLGMLFRDGLNNLLALVGGSTPGIAIYDGAGNGAENITASFTGSGVTIGSEYTQDYHDVIDSNGLSIWTKRAADLTKLLIMRVNRDGITFAEDRKHTISLYNVLHEIVADSSGLHLYAYGDPVENSPVARIDLNATAGSTTGNGSIKFTTRVGSNTWSTPAGTILWSNTGWVMTAGHTANLKYNVSTCPTGIVLHFQPYTSGTVQNYNHIYFFVPKTHVASYNGAGVVVRLGSPGFVNMATKYLYISNDHITGHADNNTTGTNSGITYNNAAWVMTQVIAV